MQTVPHVDVRVIEGINLFTAAKKHAVKRYGPGVPLTGKIVVNFIRHQLTPYDAMMDATRQDRDGYAKREMLQKATLTAIGKAYADVPQVVAEVKRQLTGVQAEADRRDRYANDDDVAAYLAARNAKRRLQ